MMLNSPTARMLRAARYTADLALATALALEIVQTENPVFGVIRGSLVDSDGAAAGDHDDQPPRLKAHG